MLLANEIKTFVITIFFLLATASFIPIKANATDRALYKITFISLWNAKDHSGFPSNAHFSPIVALNHNNSYELYSVGGFASSGFEKMAEIGSTPTLLEEIRKAQQKGVVENVTTTKPLFPRRDGDRLHFKIEVSSEFSMISFATMIAPSPDWIVGVDSFNTKVMGKFIKDTKLKLYAINAGTEEGDRPGNYSISNPPSQPHKPISSLRGVKGFKRPYATVIIHKMN